MPNEPFRSFRWAECSLESAIACRRRSASATVRLEPRSRVAKLPPSPRSSMIKTPCVRSTPYMRGWTVAPTSRSFNADNMAHSLKKLASSGGCSSEHPLCSAVRRASLTMTLSGCAACPASRTTRKTRPSRRFLQLEIRGGDPQAECTRLRTTCVHARSSAEGVADCVGIFGDLPTHSSVCK